MERLVGRLRMLLASVMVAGSLAGCGDDLGGGPPDEVEDPLVVLDMKVFVGPDWLEFESRERDRACECNGDFAESGQCTAFTDVPGCRCDPPPATCLREARIEREGRVIASKPYDPLFGGGWFSLPDLASTGDDELVLEGCGGEARIPLPRRELDEPVVTQIEHGIQQATFHWEPGQSPTPATGIASVGHTYGANICHGDDGGETSVPIGRDARTASVAFALVGERGEVDTAIGQARLWELRGTSLADTIFPAVMEDGRLSLPSTQAVLTLDPAQPTGDWPQRPEVVVDLVAFDLSADPPLLEIQGRLLPHEFEIFHYRAGPKEDFFALGQPDLPYQGSFAHVQPTAEFAVGRPLREGEVNTYRIEVGPVTLEREERPPLELSFSLGLELPAISQPDPTSGSRPPRAEP